MSLVPRPRFLSHCLFLLGIVALSYLAGASVIFFGLPPSDFLERALIGSRAWCERLNAVSPAYGQPAPPTARAGAARSVDDPSQTFDGFTLYACSDREGEGTEALLVDMRGQVVHRWQVPHWRFRLYRASSTNEPEAVHNFKPCFYGLHLDPRGNLLVVSHGPAPLAGCGLMKLDKDSNVVWYYSGPVHHDIDVDDDGTIYAVQTAMLADLPPDLEHLAGPCQIDELVLLSPDGKPLQEPISLFAAVRGSPYADLLSPLGAHHKRIHLRPESGTWQGGPVELLHTNFVQVLRPSMATKFPYLKAGQVLFSMRDVDAIAVLDVASRSVVWAASGPWRAQHAPQFLDNGRLLIFDNQGGPNGSRVLEYDPRTQAFPWSFPGAGDRAFYTHQRGMSQRLPNGNTLIVDSMGGEMMEVNRDRKLVWSYSTGDFVTSARRYAADELQFLGGLSARP